MQSETEFHQRADSTLEQLESMLEVALDAELMGGILTIELPSGRQYLISKHGASGEIWVSSPASGGLRFGWRGGVWALPDGRELFELVTSEIESLAGVAL